MKKLRFLIILFVFILALAACSPDTPANNTVLPTDALTADDPVLTDEPMDVQPSATETSMITSEDEPVFRVIAAPAEDPGFLATLGEEMEAPWYPGKVAFSADGSIVAHVSTQIRLWNTKTFDLIDELDTPYPEDCAQNAVFNTSADYFAVSFAPCDGEIQPGHVVVFDLASSEIAQDWETDNAQMRDEGLGEMSIPMAAMVFIPETAKLAYASGHTIVIRDLNNLDAESEVLDLGSRLFASQLSVRDDGEYLFALMLWEKVYDETDDVITTTGLQSWHIDPNYVNYKLNFEDMVYPDETRLLVEDYLVHSDPFSGFIQVLNLKNEELDDFPFRTGQTFFSSDMHYMVFADILNTYWRRIAVWDNWLGNQIYRFSPDFVEELYEGPLEIVFSPDNSLIAIEHNGQLTLYSIASLLPVEEEAQP